MQKPQLSLLIVLMLGLPNYSAFAKVDSSLGCPTVLSDQAATNGEAQKSKEEEANEVIDMPDSFPGTKGLMALNNSIYSSYEDAAPAFQGKKIRFSDGTVFHFGKLLGKLGRTAATYEILKEDGTPDPNLVIRVNNQIDFLTSFVAGANWVAALGIPTQTIVKNLPQEYVVLLKLEPKPIVPHGDQVSFSEASAEFLFKNWDRIPADLRKAALDEFKDFMVKSYALATFWDYQPSNIVRTKEGWKFIDPTLGAPYDQTIIESSQSLDLPFLQKKEGQWGINWFAKMSPGARQALRETAQAVWEARRKNADKLEELRKKAPKLE